MAGRTPDWAASLMTLLRVVCYVQALDNGLGLKPPMGFNTWNYFGCEVTESAVRMTADRLVSMGLAAAGYTYLNIDDCWQSSSRTPDGHLASDPVKFPSGLAALAAAVHDKGLLFGIYSDAGSNTCAAYPGSRHHESVDAETFAAWGVDFLKYDNCYAEDVDIKQRYTDMRDALNKTGRPIYFSMCSWGRANTWEWARDIGNSWRTYGDIFPNWSSMLRSLDNGAAGLAQWAGPGGWNDPDMLEVGVAQFSLAQQRSHFALWALVKAPLLLGAHLEHISPDSLNILTAHEVIAVNQDDLGVAGDIIWKGGASEVWAAPLINNTRAVVLFSRHWSLFPQTIRVTWGQLGYTSEAGGPGGFRAMVRDLYAGRDLGVYEGGFEAQVPAHDCVIIKVTPVTQQAGTPPAYTLESDAMSEVLGRASSGPAHAPGGHTTRYTGYTKGATAVPPAGVTPGVPASHTSWRPWSDPGAAELQARVRAASQRRRQWEALLGRLLAFILAHRYVLATLAVVLLLGGLTTCLAHWRLRVRARSRGRSSGGAGGAPVYGSVKYVAVEHHEMSFSGRGESLSVTGPDESLGEASTEWCLLPSRSQTPA